MSVFIDIANFLLMAYYYHCWPPTRRAGYYPRHNEMAKTWTIWFFTFIQDSSNVNKQMNIFYEIINHVVLFEGGTKCCTDFSLKYMYVLWYYTYNWLNSNFLHSPALRSRMIRCVVLVINTEQEINNCISRIRDVST